MPDFTSLFMKTKGKPVEYNGQTVHMVHFFPAKEGDVLIATIESSKSDCRQGFCIDVTGWCEMDGKQFKSGKGVRMLFWKDTAPSQIKLLVHPTNDYVLIYNIWEKVSEYLVTDERENPVSKRTSTVDSKNFGAGMIIEEIENGFRYRCNDWHPDENFDDIVFTVQKLAK